MRRMVHLFTANHEIGRSAGRVATAGQAAIRGSGSGADAHGDWGRYAVHRRAVAGDAKKTILAVDREEVILLLQL